MILVDTNIVLRYVLNDQPEMSLRAKDILWNNQTLILTQVVAEIIYVLEDVYKSAKQNTVNTLKEIFSLPNVLVENENILAVALNKYSQTKLDFVDALLYAYNQVTGLPVETFDKDLLRSLSRV